MLSRTENQYSLDCAVCVPAVCECDSVCKRVCNCMCVCLTLACVFVRGLKQSHHGTEGETCLLF